MKLNRRSLTAAALILWTCAVSAQEFPSQPAPAYPKLREYGWIEFGMSAVSDFDATLSYGSLQDDLKFRLDPGFAVHGGFGQQMLPWLAIEAQGGFLYNSASSAGSLDTLNPSLLQVPLFMNIVLQPVPERRFVPFVGAGAGAVVSWLDVDGVLNPGSPTPVYTDGSSTEAAFAYQGFAGLRLRVGREGEIALTYRLLGAGSPAWGLEDADTGSSTARLKADDIFVQTVTLAFRMRF
jgi:hypothetical protein